MRSINAKKIAAVVTGAALLGAGLAFAGQVTFQSVPIISNSGQPVVQIVVGHTAQVSDGVAAANIAAAIGNLAYTSQAVTARVDPNSTSKLGVAVSSSHYSLSNQQVWLNETGASTASGSTYIFTALIGSVLNQGIQQGSLQYTKALQGSSSSYIFPETSSTIGSPMASPYTALGQPPYISVGQSSGGGISFSGVQGSGSADNLLQITSSQFSNLKQNYGASAETEYLYLMGFPVYDQASGVKAFELAGAGAAYQVIFNKPIGDRTSGNAIQLNTPIYMLGQNYTIINASSSSTAGSSASASSSFSSSQAVADGFINLASSLAPLQTVYVGHNISSGPWTVQLQDLGQPNTSSVSAASVEVWYNGVPTNQSQIKPGALAKFNVSGNLMYLGVNQTFAGLYSYQKWAKMQLYTNVFKVSSGSVYNSSTNPGWKAELLWTNTTTSGSSASLNKLYSIIIYNQTPGTLLQGGSLSIPTSPVSYKLTFLGETLGSGSFDSLQLSTGAPYTQQYQNLGITISASFPGSTIYNITEPMQPFTVKSSIPDAFPGTGGPSSSLTYDLTPYMLVEEGNAAAFGGTNAITVVTLSYTDTSTALGTSNTVWFGSSGSNVGSLQATVSGYTYSGHQSITEPAVFQVNTTSAQVVSASNTLAQPLYNVTGIQVNRALPIYDGGSISYTVITENAQSPAGPNTLAILANTVSLPALLYTPPNTNQYQMAASVASLLSPGATAEPYNQQNGQPETTFTIAQGSAPANTLLPHQAYTYSMKEIAVATNTLALDTLAVGIYNNSVTGSPSYIINYSTSRQDNNASYTTAEGGTTVQAPVGFRTERGSKIGSISPTSDVFDIAEAVDGLQFAVTSATSNTAISKGISKDGPYLIGQATNIPNVTIAAVNATIALSGTSSYTVSGVNALTATPSVSQALVPVPLKNLTTSPLVVLDNSSQVNSGSSLILIGSGYVNTLSKTLETAYNITGDSSATGTPVTQAFGTNRILIAGYTAAQTTASANNFITQLYAAATTT